MKVVILAGGLGTRISEETYLRPKPMVEIGGRPILWHIMKIYSSYGFNDFVVCCGYKGYMIKEYFSNYFLHTSDVTFDIRANRIEVHQKFAEPWKVTVVDTGEFTQTGGRLKRAREFVGNEAFCFTYGDGVSDVNIRKLVEFHKKRKGCATVTAVQPAGRYGSLNVKKGQVLNFREKPKGDGGWVNGGFFVLEPNVFDWIKRDGDSWENDVLPRIAEKKELSAYHHRGFWCAMDTLRDKTALDELWNGGKAPWKVW